ncbi:MAG: hypothetical protein ACE5IL_08285 [Myxococcota bacterium]
MTATDPTRSAHFDRSGGFSFVSRGDRVLGVYRDAADAERPAPVVLVCGARGAARSADVERAFSQLRAWATAAAIDLPLCGARHSEKLSAQALDPEHCLARTLGPDLERQVAADLEGAFEVLRQRSPAPDPRMGLVAFGIGARLARGFCQSFDLLAAHLLSSNEPSERDWSRLRRSLQR